MTTVYITGQGKCKKKVRKALSKSNLEEGDHYIEGVSPINGTLLYWKSGRITLRDLKLAIGAKLIWEFRLRFHENIDEITQKETNNNFSIEEQELINEYRE